MPNKVGAGAAPTTTDGKPAADTSSPKPVKLKPVPVPPNEDQRRIQRVSRVFYSLWAIVMILFLAGDIFFLDEAKHLFVGTQAFSFGWVCHCVGLVGMFLCLALVLWTKDPFAATLQFCGFWTVLFLVCGNAGITSVVDKTLWSAERDVRTVLWLLWVATAIVVLAMSWLFLWINQHTTMYPWEARRVIKNLKSVNNDASDDNALLAGIVDGLNRYQNQAADEITVLRGELTDFHHIQRETEMELMDATNDVLKLEEVIDNLQRNAIVPGAQQGGMQMDQSMSAGSATSQSWATRTSSGVLVDIADDHEQHPPGSPEERERLIHHVQEMKRKLAKVHGQFIQTQANLKTVVEQSDAALAKRDTDLREMAQLCDAKHRQLVDLQREHDRTHNELVNATQNRAAVAAHRTDQASAITELQADLRRMRALAFSHPATKEERAEFVAALQADLAQMNKKEDEYLGQIAQLRAREQAAANDSSTLQSSMTTTTTTTASHTTTSSSPNEAGEQLQQSRAAVMQLNSVIETLKATVAARDQELAQLRGEASKAREQATRENAHLTAQLNVLQQSTNRAGGDGGDGDSDTVEMLNVEIAELQAELAEARLKITQQQAVVSETVASHSQCSKTISKLEKEINAISKEHAQFMQRGDKRNQLIAEAKAKWVKMRPQIGCEFRDGPAHGVMITRVKEGKPCHLAGCRAGDVVEQVNGVETLNNEEFKIEMQKYQPGDQVPFLIDRKSVILTTVVQIGSPGMSQEDIQTIRRLARGHVHEHDLIL